MFFGASFKETLSEPKMLKVVKKKIFLLSPPPRQTLFPPKKKREKRKEKEKRKKEKRRLTLSIGLSTWLLDDRNRVPELMMLSISF